MNHLFYNTFNIGTVPIVILCGDDTAELVGSTLAREISGQNQNALIFSDVPMAYPVEGQVLVDIEPELLAQKIVSQNGQIWHLCKELKDDRLFPLEPLFLTRFIPLLPENSRLLFLLKGQLPQTVHKVIEKSGYGFINTFGYGNFTTQLNDFFNELNGRKNENFTESLKNIWKKWVAEFCPQTGAAFQPFARILFFNQIKSLIDENQVIPIVRTLNDFYDRVFIGDINEYKLKEV
jgi:hypothetical protein